MIDPSEESPRPKREASRRSSEVQASLPDAEVFSLGSTGARTSAAARTELATGAPDPVATHNTIFETLVASETDLAGFIAYGLYKQSKRDWYMAFEKEHRRPPNTVEIRAYIVGESTERRLATYRHLAEETLAARTTDVSRAQLPVALAHAPPSEAMPLARRRKFASDYRVADRRGGRPVTFAAYVAILALIVVGMAWLLRSGLLPFGLGKW